MTLSEWLKNERLTHEEFARKVGVSTSTITRLLPNEKRLKRQRRRPSVQLVDLIVRETAGAVTEREIIAEALAAGPHGAGPVSRCA